MRITRATALTVNRKNIAGTAGIDTIIVTITIRIPVGTILGIEELTRKNRASFEAVRLLRVSELLNSRFAPV